MIYSIYEYTKLNVLDYKTITIFSNYAIHSFLLFKSVFSYNCLLLHL